MSPFLRSAFFAFVTLATCACGSSGGTGSQSTAPADGDAGSSGNDASDASGHACVAAEPEVVADNEPAPTAIVADAAHAYWLRFSDKALVRAPVTGGPVEILEDKAGSYDLAIDDGNVYLASTAGIVAIDKASRSKTKLGDASWTRGIAARGGYVVWESSGVTLWSTAGSKTLRPSTGSARGFRNIAIDGTTIYDATGSLKVERFGLDGASLGQLPLESGLSLRVGETHVYAAHLTGATPGVSYVAKSGGEVKTMAFGEMIDDKGQRTPSALAPIDIAVDGDTVFALTSFGVQWARLGEASFHAMQSMPTLSEAVPSTGNNGIAVNATHVFWTGRNLGNGRGQVYRIARCK
jgi:hypothetical protein